MATAVMERSASLIDAKPYLPRNADNPISLAEAARDQLYEQLTASCEAVGIQAMLAKSPPYSPEIWVRVEIWRRLGEQEQVTGRAWATITVKPKPFHRLPQEYQLEYDVCGRHRKHGPLGPFDASDLRELVLYLSGASATRGFQLNHLRTSPLQFWRTRNRIDRVRTDHLPLACIILAVAGLVLGNAGLLGPAAFLLAGSVVGFFFLWREPRLVLSTGRPAQEPRLLIRTDSWQVVLRGLADVQPQFRAELLAELEASLPSEARLTTEDIWYWGVDGKEERKQIVIAFRRALAFVQVYAYHHDLFIGWDTHVNGGTWREQAVLRGLDRETGMRVAANSITTDWHVPNEYDVTDVGYLAEWVHAIVVERVKEAAEVHRITQEIDFKILREERRSVTGAKRTGGTGAASSPRDRLANVFRRTA